MTERSNLAPNLAPSTAPETGPGPTAIAPSDTASAESGHHPVPAPAGDKRVGRVVAVTGSQVVVLLDSIGGELPGGKTPPLQIGTLVKANTAHSVVFGMIAGLSIPIPSQDSGEPELRIVELELVGEALQREDGRLGAFQRGVSFCPTLGDPIFLADNADLRRVYARPEVSSVQIGTIHQDQTLPAYAAVDDLLGKHLAVLGTTGSGKSCAVALILQSILGQHTSGHVLLFDLHNEYCRALGDQAAVLGPDSLDLPYWLLNFDEISQVVIGPVKEDREADLAILKDAIFDAKRAYHGEKENAELITADTPVPYRLSDVARRIDDAVGRLDKPTDSAPYLRLKERLSVLKSDRRYAFMFPGVTVRDNMAAIVSRLFRVPVDDKPVAIVDLSSVPSEILNVVISLLARLAFDFALWSDRKVPILLVCEEAHRYVGQNIDPSFARSKRALARIAREGRKYGLSLCLVSQRPSDLDVEVLSQCNTIFALRMGNQKDQDFVRGTLSESALGLMDSLPTLRTGEAIAVGEGVAVPVRLCFDELPPDRRPLSGTAAFSAAWDCDDGTQDFVGEIVRRWRVQRR